MKQMEFFSRPSILMALKLRLQSSGMMPCSFVDISSTLKMEAAGFSITKIPVPVYQTTLRHITEDCNPKNTLSIGPFITRFEQANHNISVHANISISQLMAKRIQALHDTYFQCYKPTYIPLINTNINI
jgi:hypothetical protein